MPPMPPAAASPRAAADASRGAIAPDVVACGSGALRLLELQRPGGRRGPAAQVLQGKPLTVGERLGD
ncbi:MAG TPA: hypothetical protein PLU79_17550 [Burkholderiaceae bacterium]|nr:hypothetical protein [Burkholderiaceae bacterium]